MDTGPTGAGRTVAGLPQSTAGLWVDVPTIEGGETPVPEGTTAPGTGPSAPTGGEGMGDWIGPYRLGRVLGGGGMGVVYEAEQERPVRRTVAVKLIRAGLDGEAMVARFEAERQALAMMDHPNIARVLDAGTTDAGRPYFVMEKVEGASITAYADAGRLSIRARLGLFVAACRAVQHAHQKGIIHRDIKPSNVLVAESDGRPLVKVIDFGVAKAVEGRLTDRTFVTQPGAVVGTLESMSPEQAGSGAEDVDTKTDVFALGVLLFELLAGSTPLDRDRLRGVSYGEILRRIREEDAPRPSSRLEAAGAGLVAIAGRRGTDPGRLLGQVRGELDWIALKALEKDRGRRYETANALARDVERSLADEPIEACPPSRRYRLGKFVRRNRGAVATAGLVVASLVVGVVATAWQAIRATSAESDAMRAANAALKARDEADRHAAESARLAERRRVDGYPPRIKLAQQAWAEGDLGRMRQVLDALAPEPGQADLRGFEWRYLDRIARARDRTYAHPGPVRAVAVSPDGALVATSGPGTGGVWIWDAATAEVRHRIDVGASVESLAFAPDGASLAGACGDGFVRTWEPSTGTPRLTFRGPGTPLGPIAYSPDGGRLATAVGGWSLRDRDPTGHFRRPDWTRPGPIGVYEAATGARLMTLAGHAAHTLAIAFGPDGRTLASGGADTALRVWDLDTRAERFAIHEEDVVLAVAFTPDGTRVVTAGGDPYGRVRDARTGRLVRAFAGSAGSTLAIAVGPDGREILTGGSDRLVRRWDLDSGREIGRTLGHTRAVVGLAADRAWRTIVTAGWDGDVHAWPGDSPQECARLPGETPEEVACFEARFSPDSARLAATTVGSLRIFDVDARRPLRTVPIEGDLDVTLAFSPDGRWLAGGGEAGTLHRWDTATWADRPVERAHSGPIDALAFAPSGGTLATVGRAEHGRVELNLWPDRSEAPTLRIEARSAGVKGLAFSPDGRTLAYGSRSRIGRIDVATGSELPSLPGSLQVAASPDGTTLAVGRLIPDENDLVEIDLRDAATGAVRARLRGHTAAISRVAFAPDGRTLATASWDGTVRLWHVATGEELMAIRRGLGSVWTVAFAPDGSRMAIGTGRLGHRELSLWDARPLSPAPPRSRRVGEVPGPD